MASGASPRRDGPAAAGMARPFNRSPPSPALLIDTTPRPGSDSSSGSSPLSAALRRAASACLTAPVVASEPAAARCQSAA